MDWPNLISTLIATAAGGLISIIALLLKWRIDRHKEAADWFFNRYVEEGFDALIQFLDQWFILAALPSHSPAAAFDHPKFDEVPCAAISRVNDITDDEGLFHWFQAINATIKRVRGAQDISLAVEVTSAIGTQVLQLKQLRSYLVSIGIKSKRDAHRLRDIEPVKSFVKTQRDVLERFHSGPMRSFAQEYRAQSQEKAKDVQQCDQAEHQ
ncbi:hypothetical protein JXA32_09780 [Candidatus Sumerlaeota bacterium]|nr:hypothetical protein [Candidatus Sumerlaeota bacterium]